MDHSSVKPVPLHLMESNDSHSIHLYQRTSPSPCRSALKPPLPLSSNCLTMRPLRAMATNRPISPSFVSYTPTKKSSQAPSPSRSDFNEKEKPDFLNFSISSSEIRPFSKSASSAVIRFQFSSTERASNPLAFIAPGWNWISTHHAASGVFVVGSCFCEQPSIASATATATHLPVHMPVPPACCVWLPNNRRAHRPDARLDRIQLLIRSVGPADVSRCIRQMVGNHNASSRGSLNDALEFVNGFSLSCSHIL